MEKKIVAKFGGSNLKRREDILRLVEVIRAYNRPMVIVVSAFYGITNQLVSALEEVKKDEKHIASLTRFLLEMKEEVIRQNFSDENKGNNTLKKITQRVNELERYLTGVHFIGDVPEFVEDVVLSYGERLSSLLLTEILINFGIDAEEALPENLPLITDGEFGNATVDFTACATKVNKALSGNKIYVVPGFYGVSQDGKVTILGRGGSDYSAASIARCVDAESLDVWKDVDGFMSGNPKLVENPVRISSLSYTEAAELSYFGAGILHPRTVEPLQDLQIPIHICNIDDFVGSTAPRTIIHNQETITDVIAKSVSYSDDFCILTLQGAGVGTKRGVLAKATNALDRAGINIKSVITSQIAINILLSKQDLKRAYEIISEMHLPTIMELKANDQLSTIAVVGEGILDKPGVAGKMFMALAKESINVRLIASGASPVASYFIVSSNDRDQAVRAIHNEFFSSK